MASAFSDTTAFDSGADTSSAPRRGKTIVLCFDGTGNYYGPKNTNIVKIFSFLEKNKPDEQLVYYQPGVGTYVGPALLTSLARSITLKLDFGFAFSLESHVMAGYTYLMDNWVIGDRICIFGFSRGAYTARALAGMLYSIGLLPKAMKEEVPFAFGIYKRGDHTAAYRRDFSRDVFIDFLGVFDTVSAVGALVPRTLPFSSDNHITRVFRHAMSLDERRASFQPEPWHRGTDDAVPGDIGRPKVGVVRTLFWAVFSVFVTILDRISPARKRQDQKAKERELRLRLDLDKIARPDAPPTDVKEVWFAGAHQDNGGGAEINSVKYQLSNITLRWMMKEVLLANQVRKIGLLFKETDALKELGIVLNPGKAAQDAAERLFVHGRTNPAFGEGPGLHEIDDAPSAYQKNELDPIEEVVAPIHDPLSKFSGYWVLEFLPFIYSKQAAKDDHWDNRVRFNLGRARTIQEPPADENPNNEQNQTGTGVNLPSETLFHFSVQRRMDAQEAYVSTWKNLWTNKVPYHYAAKLENNDVPRFVH